jgi:hypothetical protein
VLRFPIASSLFAAKLAVGNSLFIGETLFARLPLNKLAYPKEYLGEIQGEQWGLSLF